MNMRQLWDKARFYGRVRLSTQNSGMYHCSIEFNTIEHVELTARSSFDCPTPEEALTDAIDNAEKIISSLERAAEGIKRKLAAPGSE